MPDAVFPFPGGKSRLASWILRWVPEHTCFVEVFGGAAGILVNKDPDTSSVEVYNDRDGDLVHFFETLREQPGELTEWLADVPFSREVFDEWAELYYQGYRPRGDVERAGRFFYLRYANWGATYSGKGGFATATTSSKAATFSNKTDRLREFADRFDDVVIENLDWSAVVEKYDREYTVFYADPPYVETSDYYPHSEIDHDALLQELNDVEGYALLSLEKIPEGHREDWRVTGQDVKRGINSGKSGSAKDARENLLLNFDPEVVEG
ncbi:DNA adenine methylase [Halolamina rubra]|uniref:DNA adenine methylase n=1 Tax=Halolamina rubra TaxID=1380430 RepID=UPI0006790A90|nr:DNA adenine methylase [Halolamina rubra]